MPDRKNPFTSPDMKQYFASLPPLVQESIEQSGIYFDTLDELKLFVNKLYQ